MSSDDKDRLHRTAQNCIFYYVLLVCTTALGMTLYATGHCAFIDRHVILTEKSSTTSFCDKLNIPQDYCSGMLENHGVSFWAWKIAFPADQQACFAYNQYIEGLGDVTPPFDGMFNVAKACEGVAIFFGAFAWLTMLFSLCCRIGLQFGMKYLSFCFFIACIAQSLAFLIFLSAVCDVGFFSAYSEEPLPVDIESVSCRRNKATNMAIAAVMLNFCATCLSLVAVAPDPAIEFCGERQDAVARKEYADDGMAREGKSPVLPKDVA